MQPNTIYQGRFKGLDERIIYTVRFEFEKDNTASGQHIISIGDPGDDIRFAGENTVEIQSQVNDTFDHIMQTSATIRLLVKDDHPEFYVSDYRKVMVTIYGKQYDNNFNYANPNVNESNFGIILFSGYVEPMSYQQGFDQEWDELEINCIDILSATKYRKYRNITTKSAYDAFKAHTANRSLLALIFEAIYGSADGVVINLTPEGYCASLKGIMYDRSIKTSETGSNNIFGEVYLNEAIFFGDEFDNIATYYDVLENIMQYLNLRMTTDDGNILIYSFDKLKNMRQDDTQEDYDPDEDIDTTITFYDIYNPFSANYNVKTRSIGLSIDNSISRAEVFNNISVKADFESMDYDIVDDPLDSKGVTSDFSPELYGRELISYGSGTSAKERFKQQVRTGNYHDDGCSVHDKYYRILRHSKWQGINVTPYPTSQFRSLFTHLNSNAAAMVAFGDTNSFQDMDRYIVVKPKTNRVVNATYNGTDTVNLNPTSGLTNYIIIDCKMLCTPSIDNQLTKWRYNEGGIVDTGGLNRLNAFSIVDKTDSYPKHKPYHANDSTPWRYTFDFYNNGSSTAQNNILPPSDHMLTARIMAGANRQAMLRCQLWITGDNGVTKYVSEDSAGNLTWVNNYSFFYLPITIKKGDYFIGTEFSVTNQNYGNYAFDDKGLIIPINSGDVPGGKFNFKIYQLADISFTEGTSAWDEVDALFIRDLSIKVKANQKAADDFTDKSDVVYSSKTDASFVNNKEFSFKINSALTTDDIAALGLEASDKIIISNPLLKSANIYNPLTSIYSCITKRQDKAEAHFVDAAYREHSRPFVEMQMTVPEGLDADNPGNRDKTGVDHSYVFYHPFSFWRMPEGLSTISKKFYPYAISHNLQQCTAEIKIKECNYKEEEPATSVIPYTASK